MEAPVKSLGTRLCSSTVHVFNNDSQKLAARIFMIFISPFAIVCATAQYDKLAVLQLDSLQWHGQLPQSPHFAVVPGVPAFLSSAARCLLPACPVLGERQHPLEPLVLPQKIATQENVEKEHLDNRSGNEIKKSGNETKRSGNETKRSGPM